MYKIIARHKWINGAIISESVDENNNCRFIATIHKFRNWKIYEGKYREKLAEDIRGCVSNIRDLIVENNEEIFNKKGFFLK